MIITSTRIFHFHLQWYLLLHSVKKSNFFLNKHHNRKKKNCISLWRNVSPPPSATLSFSNFFLFLLLRSPSPSLTCKALFLYSDPSPTLQWLDHNPPQLFLYSNLSSKKQPWKLMPLPAFFHLSSQATLLLRTPQSVPPPNPIHSHTQDPSLQAQTEYVLSSHVAGI